MVERERKFFVNPKLLPPDIGTSRMLTTGYFTNGKVAIRVAIDSNGKGKVCFKGPGTQERQEFEYEIPYADATALLDLSPTVIVKRRYDYQGWEVDHFPKLGFWMAEWEEHEGKVAIPDPLPAWLGQEVTEDPRYTNMALAWKHGFRGGK